jgi:hypothetical protein
MSQWVWERDSKRRKDWVYHATDSQDRHLTSESCVFQLQQLSNLSPTLSLSLTIPFLPRLLTLPASLPLPNAKPAKPLRRPLLPIRRKAIDLSPKEIPEPDLSGSILPESMPRRIERAAR